MNNAATQAKRVAKLKAEGGVRRSFELQPATVAALRELRARGAVSDARAVNDAVVFYAECEHLADTVL